MHNRSQESWVYLFYGSSVRHVQWSREGVVAEMLKTCMQVHFFDSHVNTTCKFPCTMHSHMALLRHVASFNAPCKRTLKSEVIPAHACQSFICPELNFKELRVYVNQLCFGKFLFMLQIMIVVTFYVYTFCRTATSISSLYGWVLHQSNLKLFGITSTKMLISVVRN